MLCVRDCFVEVRKLHQARPVSDFAYHRIPRPRSLSFYPRVETCALSWTHTTSHRPALVLAPPCVSGTASPTVAGGVRRLSVRTARSDTWKPSADRERPLEKGVAPQAGSGQLPRSGLWLPFPARKCVPFLLEEQIGL